MSKKSKTIRCIDNGRTYTSPMQLAHALNVYETSVLDHLAKKTPKLLGCKYVYVDQ